MGLVLLVVSDVVPRRGTAEEQVGSEVAAGEPPTGEVLEPRPPPSDTDTFVAKIEGYVVARSPVSEVVVKNGKVLFPKKDIYNTDFFVQSEVRLGKPFAAKPIHPLVRWEANHRALHLRREMSWYPNMY